MQGAELRQHLAAKSHGLFESHRQTEEGSSCSQDRSCCCCEESSKGHGGRGLGEQRGAQLQQKDTRGLSPLPCFVLFKWFGNSGHRRISISFSKTRTILQSLTCNK